jgi:hypothetical protein
MKKLLNYTSEVPVERTIGEIQRCLSTHGATAILTDYEDSYVKAISFKIIFDGNPIGFRLPTDWKPVFKILMEGKKEYSDQKLRDRQASQVKEQAVRTAWRIVKDWEEAQMAIVDTQMVTMEEVFLPYAVTNSGQTLAEKFKAGGNLLGSGN